MQLFKSVAERGKWSSWFTEAYTAYKAGDIETALIKYYVLAELGYEAAQSNVAYILDKGNILIHVMGNKSTWLVLMTCTSPVLHYDIQRAHLNALKAVLDY